MIAEQDGCCSTELTINEACRDWEHVAAACISKNGHDYHHSRRLIWQQAGS